MANLLTKSLPPQSIQVYSLLKQKGKLSAVEIAKYLEIFPHAVYRAVKPLQELGLVVQQATYPQSFGTFSMAESSEILAMTIKANFNELFANDLYENNSPQLLNLIFIKDRDDLLEKTGKDILYASKSIDFIVSGLEIPAESVFAYKRAASRGVVMRAIIQNKSEATKGLLRTWKNFGIDVRYFYDMEARVFIIDNEIVYFTSYNYAEKENGTGIRFHYPPFAKLMNELFEQRWKKSTEL